MIDLRLISRFYQFTAMSVFILAGGLSSASAQVAPALDFVPVPATDAQPGGPVYDFRISRYEVRNDQFAVFLNDAIVDAQTATPGPRSDYMLFDSVTGDIYIQSQQVGQLVSAGSGNLMFSLAGNSHITFNAATSVYEVEVGFESHPATGVSWYGALKYCNWLTLDAGIPASQRCYTEAPSTNLNGWHPATISDVLWAARDLNDAERQLLVTTYLGFRLPMDGGDSMAAPYNEWYKAAAWDDFSFVNYAYGFGRDAVNAGDANFNASGDPFEPGTTPVGFYDGTTYNPGGGGMVGDGVEFVSVADTNAYGLFDMSGNVWEWMQGNAADPALRRYRGGGHNSTDFFVSNTTVTNDIAAGSRDWVGLRIVHADPGLDPLVDPDEPGKFTGPIGGPFAPEPDPLAYTLTSQSHDPIDWQVTSNVNWLDINGDLIASGTLAPFASIEILLTTNDDALTKLVGDFAAVVTFDVDLQSFTIRDVMLSVSEELDVVPVTGIMASGPTGGPFFPGEQIYTVTNGSTELLSLCVTSTQPWVLIDDVATVCSSVAPSLSSNFTVSIKIEDAILFPPGEIQSAVVSFTDQVSGAAATRAVAVSVGLAPLTIDMASVPAIDVEPSGPTHDYRVGKFEVSNAEFVAFLNDALFNTTNERGEYMAHDTTLGDVYINTGPTGQIGSIGSGIIMFDASDGGRITYDTVQYRVVPDTEDEPVSGVSWYGALKFCNWLTLRQGMPASERAYSEGPNAGEWHPATISTLDWWGTVDTANNPSPVAGSRDLNNAERNDLVSFAGYRLPMDDGQSSTSLFNEWYKAASWINDIGFGTTDLASQDGVSSCDGGAAMADVWWKYTPTSDGTVTLTVETESGITPVLSIHDDCPGSLCDEISCSNSTGLFASVIADTEYWVRVAVDANQSTKFSLTITGPPCVANNGNAHDNCGSAPAICPTNGGVHVLYGFGQDVLSGADANFLFSDDPFVDVTEVGWFDGVNKIDSGSISTNDTANAYGLYDICGNVSEWMQDVGSQPEERTTRGGNWQNNIVSLLLTNTEREIDLASATRAFTGLRVVQSEFNTGLDILSACGSVDANECLSTAPIGGAFAPASFDYSLSNNSASVATEYRVCIDADWLSINETESCIEGLVEPSPAGMPGVTADFTLAFNEMADVLPAPATPAFPMTVIPATDAQPNGPRYSYRIATLETTNESFVKFLNNALLSLSNERGQYMYFNSATGDVFINDDVLGEVGMGASGRTTLLFSPAANARVSYDLLTSKYVVEMDFENHPVTGVSWFGAVKYCNWLTISDGLGVASRAYSEGVSPGDWHPVTISTCAWWGVVDTLGQLVPQAGARDLNANEREDLITNFAGYRLPMDEFTPSASAYNEWYKAAAWDASLSVNHDYGFGRDMAAGLTSADANFLTSGDSFEPDATPVGFYDGTIYNPGGGGMVGDGVEFTTVAETNAYELFDLSGNVAEWMQDRGGINDPQLHSFRGGSFDDDTASGAHLATAQNSALPGSTLSNVGFRIVQSKLDQIATLTITDVTAEVSVRQGIRLILREPFAVSPEDGFSSQGVFGGPFSINDKQYTLTSESATDMDWEAVVSTTGTRWLDVNGAVSDSGTLSNQVPEFVDVTLNRSADTLSPGTYSATVTFTNMTTGHSETRDFELIIDETLIVDCSPTPMDDCTNEIFSVGIVWSSTAIVQSRTYALSNLSAGTLDYSIATLPDWLELDDPTQMMGTLAAAGDADGEDMIEIIISTNDALENEPIGFVEDLSITFNNVTASSAIDLPLEINVRDPLDIAPLAVDDDPNYTWTKQAAGNYVLSAGNGTYVVAVAFPAEISVDYNVTSDVDWLDLNGATSVADTILSGFTQSIVLTINNLADNLGGGVHTATISFNDITATNIQTRTITLVVTGDLALTPLEDYDIFAPVGGPFTPLVKTFTLINGSTFSNVSWSAQSNPAVSWLRINGAAMTMSSLPAGENVEVILSVDPVIAASLAIGLYTTELTIEDNVGSTPITRMVTLKVSSPSFVASPMLVTNISGSAQPDGPTYPFMIDPYETTNAAFIVFLNDALANPANERGQYIYVDQLNGDVYINSSISGAVGDGPGGLTTKMFSPSVANHISYNKATNSYSIASLFIDVTSHPVTGVSWYGAVKYCNWLTLDQGLPPSYRCYAEDVSSNLNGWRPAVISDTFWGFRGLVDAERADFVTNYLGYRLPMDDGVNNSIASIDSADDYNEWYAAAAWDLTASVNRKFGFGRDAIISADANYSLSDDPFEANTPATSPVGFYDGINLLGNMSTTVTTSNAFGLFDMTGNVYEWVQGRFSGSDTIHAARGGSWTNVYPSTGMNLTTRLSRQPDSLNHSIGFRVLRSLKKPTGDQDLDADIDLVDFIQLSTNLVGPSSVAIQQTAVFDFDFDSDIDLQDFAVFQRMFLP